MLLGALLIETFGDDEFTALTLRQQTALYTDLNDMMREENLTAREAVVTLRNRIRPATLQTYARTLTAGC